MRAPRGSGAQPRPSDSARTLEQGGAALRPLADRPSPGANALLPGRLVPMPPLLSWDPPPTPSFPTPRCQRLRSSTRMVPPLRERNCGAASVRGTGATATGAPPSTLGRTAWGAAPRCMPSPRIRGPNAGLAARPLPPIRCTPTRPLGIAPASCAVQLRVLAPPRWRLPHAALTPRWMPTSPSPFGCVFPRAWLAAPSTLFLASRSRRPSAAASWGSRRRACLSVDALRPQRPSPCPPCRLVATASRRPPERPRGSGAELRW